MTKYMKRSAVTTQQETEAYNLLDKALELPFKKAVLYPTTPSRAQYLHNLLSGIIYRSAIESLSIYSPGEPYYGKGLYYNLVVEEHPKGIVIANVENPPITTLTWQIIECAATKQRTPFTGHPGSATTRLRRLKERHPEQLGHVYVTNNSFYYGDPTYEELVIVDIDVNPQVKKVYAPDAKQRAKVNQ